MLLYQIGTACTECNVGRSYASLELKMITHVNPSYINHDYLPRFTTCTQGDSRKMLVLNSENLCSLWRTYTA